MAISKEDMREIQRSDIFLNSIIQDLKAPQQSDISKDFTLNGDLLFKVCAVFGQAVHKLALPPHLASNLLKLIHDNLHCHISSDADGI